MTAPASRLFDLATLHPQLLLDLADWLRERQQDDLCNAPTEEAEQSNQFRAAALEAAFAQRDELCAKWQAAEEQIAALRQQLAGAREAWDELRNDADEGEMGCYCMGDGTRRVYHCAYCKLTSALARAAGGEEG